MYFNIPSTFLADTMNAPNMDIDKVTTGVVNVAEAISNYGIAIVVLAVFFVIFLILIILMLYTNNKMMSSILKNNQNSTIHDQELLTKIVDRSLGVNGGSNDGVDSTSNDTVVNILSKQLAEATTELRNTFEAELRHEREEQQDDYHKDLVGSYVNINMAFKNISRETLTRLNCDRVAIYIFHNGNKSMFGLPFFKMSCIHEWTVRGANTLRGKSHTDLPLHAFDDFIYSLHEYGVFKIENIEKIKDEDSSIKDFFSYSNSKAAYMIAVKSSNNVIAGFVSAEFAYPDTFERDDHRDMEIRKIITDMVDKIAPIISNQYQNENNG